MASQNVERVAGRVGRVASKISGPTALMALGTIVSSVGFYNAEIFQDAAGLEFARNVGIGGAGLGLASLVAAWTGKDIASPADMIRSLRGNDPRDILKKAGQMVGKNPDKAISYMESRLDKMSLKQREAFSNYVRYDSKMSQFRSEKPDADAVHVAKGREVFRSASMGISLPRREHAVGYDIK